MKREMIRLSSSLSFQIKTLYLGIIFGYNIHNWFIVQPEHVTTLSNQLFLCTEKEEGKYPQAFL